MLAVMSIRILVLAAACGACRGSQPAMPAPPPVTHPAAPQPRAALDTPERAVAAYFQAGDQHDSRLIRAAFHPTTAIQSVGPDGTARALSQIEWWPKVDAPGAPALSRRQRTLDRSGDLALIEADSRWAGFRFDDLLLVVRDADRWTIVGKVFARLGPDEVVPVDADDDRAIRGVLAQKIAAHADYDPELLLASHLVGCRYTHVDDHGLTNETLSEHAAGYAAHHDAGETDHVSPWRILSVTVRGSIAAATLDVIWQGRRNVDHLLLLKVGAGWKIAAAAWGPAAPR